MTDRKRAHARSAVGPLPGMGDMKGAAATSSTATRVQHRTPARRHARRRRARRVVLPAPGADADWALVLDVDTLLQDFEPGPDSVIVDARLHDALKWMHSRLGGAVALLSGQPLSELNARFAWDARAAVGRNGAKRRTQDNSQALAAILCAQPFQGREPWVLASGPAVEPLFQLVNGRGGTSIIVGARRGSVARFALPDAAAARAWLHALAWR